MNGRMFSESPGLAPDLEWMLKSNQVGDTLILETLVHEAYSPVFRLALSILDDEGAAHHAAFQTFSLALGEKHRYRSELPVKTWLFGLALRVCRRRLAILRWSRAGKALLAPFKRAGAETLPLPRTEQEAQLWLALDALPQKLSLPLKLHSLHRLSEVQIASCLRIPEQAARRRLETARRRLAQGHPSPAEWDAMLVESLGRRWPELDPAVQGELEKLSASGQGDRPAYPLRKVMLSGLGLLAILLTGWLSFALFPGEEQGSLAVRTQKVVSSVRATPTRPPLVAPTLPLVPPRSGAASGGNELGGEENLPDGLAGLPARRQIDLPPILVTLYGEESLDMWSNSGPILLSRVLDYWDVPSDPDLVTRSLQPSAQDENVMPYELVNYVEEQTSLKAIYRLGGDYPTLARLIEAGFLAILEKGYTGVYAEGWLGHYVLASGYDRTRGMGLLLTNTIEYQPRSRVRYSKFQQDWQAFNYSYLVVYPPEKEAELAEILGENFQAGHNYRQAYIKASQEIYARNSRLEQFHAWFNRGASLSYLEDYLGAAQAFDQAFSIFADLPAEDRPQRLLWYQSRPFWAYFYSQRYRDVIRLADQTLATMPSPVTEESLYWRALAREGLGDLEGAIADLKESLRLNPNFSAGSAQLRRLEGSAQWGRN